MGRRPIKKCKAGKVPGIGSTGHGGRSFRVKGEEKGKVSQGVLLGKVGGQCCGIISLWLW